MEQLSPLTPVTGGVVDPDDLIGRRAEQARLVQDIASGGAYVVGDRRMGKTSLLARTARDLRAAGHVVVIVSAETDRLDTFNQTLLAAVRHERAFAGEWRSWTKSFRGEVRLNVGVAGIRLEGELSKPGRRAPETDLMQLCSTAARRVGAASFVLVIDEIAQLANFLHEDDPAAGAEFLRALRRLRQGEGSHVRIVLAGSVGLHHAVDDRTAINDLPQVYVGPLAHDDAVVLARRLMLGVCGREDAESAERLADAVSDVAYYVQRLMADTDPAEDLATVDWEARVDRAIDDNLWETDHYVRRLRRYYPDDLPYAALDDVAATGPTSVADLTRRLSALPDPPTQPGLGDLVEELIQDHYLRYGDGEIDFVSPMMRRIWVRARGRLR